MDKADRVPPCTDSQTPPTSSLAAARPGRGPRTLGIDTEFMSEGRYRALLCLTQVAVEDPSEPTGIQDDPDRRARPERRRAAAGASCSPTRQVEIVLHAGRQDVAILRRAWATQLTNIFDTQIAAGLRRRERPVRLRQPAQRRARAARRQDRELHALGRTPADRRAAQLRGRGRRPPAAAGRRAPAPAATRPAAFEWAVEECRRLETRHRRTRPRDRMGAPAAGRASSTRRRERWPSAWPPGASAPRRPRTAPSARCCRTRRCWSWPSAIPDKLTRSARSAGSTHRSSSAAAPSCSRRSRAGLADPPIPREARRGHSDSSDAPLIALAEALLRARAMEAGPGLRADRVPQRPRADHRRGSPVGARARRAHARRLAPRAGRLRSRVAALGARGGGGRSAADGSSCARSASSRLQ